ncbi:MAG: glutaredoxin family protein [Chloroflexi bacterium]|nr:glutaredoxin family protein [Chloroflexota bacterium]
MTRVEGENKGDITLYTLSTCGWCKKTKGLLDGLHAGYSYVNVDQLEDSERKEALDTIKEWNPQCTFPTMVIKGNILKKPPKYERMVVWHTKEVVQDAEI